MGCTRMDQAANGFRTPHEEAAAAHRALDHNPLPQVENSSLSSRIGRGWGWLYPVGFAPFQWRREHVNRLMAGGRLMHATPGGQARVEPGYHGEDVVNRQTPALQGWGVTVGFVFDPSGVLWHMAEAPF